MSYAYSSDKCDAKCPTNCDFTVTQKIKNGKSECKNCVCMTDPCKVKKHFDLSYKLWIKKLNRIIQIIVLLQLYANLIKIIIIIAKVTRVILKLIVRQLENLIIQMVISMVIILIIQVTTEMVSFNLVANKKWFNFE